MYKQVEVFAMSPKREGELDKIIRNVEVIVKTRVHPKTQMVRNQLPRR